VRPTILISLATALGVVLWVDSVTKSHEVQWLLGGVLALMLLACLRAASTQLRISVAVVVVFATTIEFVFAYWLGVYDYQLGNVPPYVPPGHGVVFLCCVLFGELSWVRRNLTVLAWVAGLGIGAWATLGVLAPAAGEGRDALGAFWAVWLIVFLRWGPSRSTYVGAAVVVTAMELWGTHLGVWTWRSPDAITGHIPMANPPAGVAGGYGWFDLAGLWVASRFTRRGSVAPAQRVDLERRGEGDSERLPDLAGHPFQELARVPVLPAEPVDVGLVRLE
jgi:hypothetical protein